MMSMEEAFAAWGTEKDDADPPRRTRLRKVSERTDEELPDLTIELSEEDIGA
jgi:hypothetical protein